MPGFPIGGAAPQLVARSIERCLRTCLVAPLFGYAL
jgi:hypothetical protein